ncbi:acyl-CoA/acyl-ACP dehydrogenase [Ignatzschineria rhizosphaerae]|uniref:Acyl-CoA/acyl-ACP dehydrogenase n=1 Tax=Ignatzschineria rhizosphaerae TaxID=2923279 RepID=A0ABY3X108_9GAMM|nr:acyl-CoA dehydrogenase family protein [Ignatzschineria rhizosphaerae]UNM96564.1 acyl-CoA/acyl-ACP dehydrogenase [Ignatzschineria rhizosphaerae]
MSHVINLVEMSSKARLDAIQEIAKAFKARAYQHDVAGTFPLENYADLRAVNFPALTVPKVLGGAGISLEEMLRLQAEIAKNDGSTGLAIGWHMGISKHLGETNNWDPALYAEFAKDVIAKGALINNAASEPATGSPTRGGRPETTAVKSANGWALNGRKTFTTLSPVLDYFAVSAGIDGSDQVASFLVKRELSGVSIEETWDSIAMSATGSHDLVLENVEIRNEDLAQYLIPGKKDPQGWLLHIPAVYFGIATGAFEEAVDFANSYSSNAMKGGTVGQFPTVQQKIGQIRVKLMEMEYFLFGVAKKWDEANAEERLEMGDELSAVKVAIVNHALEVVDLAMRIVGARSLSQKHPLSRAYRDVRAGLHNPPMEDMVYTNLAKSVLTL